MIGYLTHQPKCFERLTQDELWTLRCQFPIGSTDSREFEGTEYNAGDLCDYFYWYADIARRATAIKYADANPEEIPADTEMLFDNPDELFKYHKRHAAFVALKDETEQERLMRSGYNLCYLDVLEWMHNSREHTEESLIKWLRA